MSILTLRPQALRNVSLGPLALEQLRSVPLLLLIGVELAVLAAWLPDTIASWWSADQAGDFKTFYAVTDRLDAAGLYTPRRTLLLYPFTLLDVLNAYRLFAALGIGAALAVAYLAQRHAGSWEGRAALVLGVLSLPQLHWALRLGQFAPFLMLFALGGFLLARRRPVVAGLCFALLALKPHYVIVPVLYLAWSKNWRALVSLTAGVVALELLGFALVGFDAIGGYLSGVWDWGVDPRDDRVVSQVWQYSWGGFLASVGLTPHPLVVFDLIALSLGAVVLAWSRGARAAALPAAAFGMLLVAPYANFYDWALLAVGAALLVRANLHGWSLITPLALGALYFFALSSQGATPYPPDADATSLTQGAFWITPAVLALVGLLALSGQERFDRARRFFAQVWSR